MEVGVMKKIIFSGILIGILSVLPAHAGEKLTFISSAENVPRIFIYDPAGAVMDSITDYSNTGVAGYDITPDGRLMVTAMINPVSEDYLGLRLVTREYPYIRERIVMTYAAPGWDALRNKYKLAIDPTGQYAVCVDTLGTLLVDLQKEEIRYIFTHKAKPNNGVCEAYQNWGGEFSPDGGKVCVRSYCIANRQRYDIYDLKTREYRNVYELSNLTGFSWLPQSDGLLLSANSCGESAGLYVVDLADSEPLINLEVCNLASATCNQYFKEFYSEFALPQVLDENRLMVHARGVKVSGKVLDDVFIIDQETQVITEVVCGDFIELKMSPSERYLVGVLNTNPNATEGKLYIYDFGTKLGGYIREGDMTCSQIDWIDIK
jgi:hypothetical protein